MHLARGSGILKLDQDNHKITQKLLEQCISSQTALLKKAIHLLKPNKEMIYSTCSILSCENEEILCKVLKQEKASIQPITWKEKEELPQLPTKIEGTLCLKPTKYYEGFFIAKIKKEK